MRFKKLSDWLDWIKEIHVKPMDLGLARVGTVAKRMNLLHANCPIVTVAGTNGKGSTVAGLEAIYLAAGYRVGVFTSPFLFKFNEQVKIANQAVTDEVLSQAFQKIDDARGEITLTPFEFNTLAALEIFSHAKLDIIILEVGLGGRLDAVNIVDADVAIVTSIGVDHADYLGDTREKIAYEKAGIFRKDKIAICGDFHPPQSLMDYAHQIDAVLFCQNLQYGYETDGFTWNWWSETNRFENLPDCRLALQNMSTVLMAVEVLQSKLPVKRDAIETALQIVTLPGRLQVIEGEINQIFDVSHNPAAVEFLVTYLKKHPCSGKTRAVFSMLADKDIHGTLWVIKDFIDEWYIAPLTSERAASIKVLEYCFRKTGIETFYPCDTVLNAYQAALKNSQKGDRIIVFGSFHTVAEVLPQHK